MERVRLNETLLDIVLFVQSSQSYYTSKSILLGTQEGSRKGVEKVYRSIPQEIFRKAGILGNRYNLELALQFRVTKEMMECQAEELGNFETDFRGRTDEE